MMKQGKMERMREGKVSQTISRNPAQVNAVLAPVPLLGSELEIGSSHNSNNTGNVEETLSQRGNDVMSSAGNQTEASNSVASNYSEGKHCSSVSTECLHVSEKRCSSLLPSKILPPNYRFKKQTSGRCNLVHLCFHLLLTLSSFLYSQLLLNIMTTESLIQR